MKKMYLLTVLMLAVSVTACGGMESTQKEAQTEKVVLENEQDQEEEAVDVEEQEEDVKEPAVSEESEKEEPVSEEEVVTKEENSELVDGMRPEFREAMDAYEAFMDEYCTFMKKYLGSDGTDLTLLADYAKYMSEYAEFVDAFEEWDEDEMNSKEMAYYIDVQVRVSKKLLEVSE